MFRLEARCRLSSSGRRAHTAGHRRLRRAARPGNFAPRTLMMMVRGMRTYNTRSHYRRQVRDSRFICKIELSRGPGADAGRDPSPPPRSSARLDPPRPRSRPTPSRAPRASSTRRKVPHLLASSAFAPKLAYVPIRGNASTLRGAASVVYTWRDGRANQRTAALRPPGTVQKEALLIVDREDDANAHGAMQRC